MENKMIHGEKALQNLFDDAIDELEVTYDVYFEIEGYRPRCVHAVNLLLSRGITGGKALVLGTNERPFTMLLEKLGFTVEGFTLDQTALCHKDTAYETASDVFRRVQELRNDYDIIICDDVLQHLPSPADTISVLKDHVRPGGMLMITTPNAARGTARLRLLAGKNIFPQPVVCETREGEETRLMPYREYTLQELGMLVSGTGLEMIQSEFIIGKTVTANMWPPLPVKEYFLQKLFLAVQKVAAPLRNYLFAAARRPLSDK